jgi:hypothetical protein
VEYRRLIAPYVAKDLAVRRDPNGIPIVLILRLGLDAYGYPSHDGALFVSASSEPLQRGLITRFPYN